MSYEGKRLAANDGSKLEDLNASEVTAGLLSAARLPIVYEEEPTGVTDGVNTVFTLAFAPVSNSLTVTIDGLPLQRGVHYNLTGSTITYATPYQPSGGERHKAKYFY